MAIVARPHLKGSAMRGADHQQPAMFSVVALEDRVPADHPLRPLRTMVDRALVALSPVFDTLYAEGGRPSIPPEHLLRALLLQVLYSVRSERQLVEQLDYNLLFRWFVGLGVDEPIWVPTVFTKNRDRLLAGDIAQRFFDAVLSEAQAAELLSTEHFTVDGTLIQAWAGQKSLQRDPAKATASDDDDDDRGLSASLPHVPKHRRKFLAADDPRRTPAPPLPEEPAGTRNPTVDFHGERRANATHTSTTDPEARLARKSTHVQGPARHARLSRASADGESLGARRRGVRDRGHGHV